MKAMLIASIFLICDLLNAQNIVDNPSFEDYAQCPYAENQLRFSYSWYSPSLGTPDYFCSCDSFIIHNKNENYSSFDTPHNLAGYQITQNGEAYVGFYLLHGIYYMREYIQTELSKPLINGSTYQISFYISLAEYSKYSSDRFGICLSDKSPKIKKYKDYFSSPITKDKFEILKCKNSLLIKSDSSFNDKTDWTLLSGEYLAKGREKFLTFGLFDKSIMIEDYLILIGKQHGKIDAVAYYYLDNVSISLKDDKSTDENSEKPMTEGIPKLRHK